MLAYVLIPHQGDFLDGLPMQPGLRRADYHGMHRLQIHNETLSPFQALLQGKALAQARDDAQNCPPQDLEHPEDMVRSSAQPIPAALLQQDALPFRLPAPQLQARYSAHAPRPPPGLLSLPAHIPSTRLLI